MGGRSAPVLLRLGSGPTNRSRLACVRGFICCLERVYAVPQALVHSRPWSDAAVCTSLPSLSPLLFAWPVWRACLLEIAGALGQTRTDPTGRRRFARERIVAEPEETRLQSESNAASTVTGKSLDVIPLGSILREFHNRWTPRGASAAMSAHAVAVGIVPPVISRGLHCFARSKSPRE